MSQPNFIFITADQHRSDCLGVAGRNIRTPHLDQLAMEGTRFSTAICPSPVCQPSRAAILTGQLCRTNGVHDNGIDLEPAVGEKGFAGALGAAGYETAFFGKAHFSSYDSREKTGTPESVLSSEDYDENWFGPYMGFQHLEIMIHGHNWFTPQKPPRGQHFERFYYGSGQGDHLNELYKQNGGDTKGAAQTWHSQLPLAFHNTPWTADRAIDWLKFKRESDKPFMTWISFPDPHHPFDCPEPWSKLHDPDSVDLPVNRTRDLDNRPWWHRAAIESEPQGNSFEVETRKAYSRIAQQSDAQLREIIANTYGQISLIDHHIGRIMNALRELNIENNTYVIFSADHGDWLGDHGLVLKGPMFYDGLLRIPLIVRGPGVSAGQVVDEPVSNIDVGPTMFDLASVDPLLTQHGTSLRALMEGKDAPRDYAMSEWELLPNRVGVALSLRVVRTKTDKLTMDMRSGDGEMYDFVKDPDEMTNVFNDPAYAERRKVLEAYLAERPDDIGPIRTPVGPA